MRRPLTLAPFLFLLLLSIGGGHAAGRAQQDTALYLPLLAKGQVWSPPTGIPAPSFGIFEQAGPYTHYVDNSSPNATDLNNPFGSPSQPRLTVPTNLGPGSVVQVRGGPYLLTNNQDTWELDGTAAAPVFITGIGDPLFVSPPGEWHTLELNGAYYVLEGVVLERAGVRLYGHHGALRDSEARDYDPGKFSSVVSGSGSDFVIAGNFLHDNGPPNPLQEEMDIHGVKFTHGTENVWIVDNQIDRSAGDAVQIGDDGSPEPWAHHIYIGRNRGNSGGENCFDIKRARDVIISQNDCQGFRPQPAGSSDGAAVVVHNSPDRIWLLFNRIHDSEVGIRSNKNGANAVYVIGNLLYDLHHSTSSWDPTDGYHTGGGVNGWNNGSLYVVDNTISDVDYCISLNSSGVYHLHGNLCQGVTTTAAQTYVGSPGHALSSQDYGLFDPLARLAWEKENLILTLAELQQAYGQCAYCLEGPAGLGADYHPQAASPAIDASLRHPVYDTFLAAYGLDITVDLGGRPRPQGAAWDIGAFEGP